MQHNAVPGMMMPFPMFGNFTDQSKVETEVPGRIRIAMSFCAYCCQKTDITVAGGDSISPQQFDGQELEVEEKQALHAACRLLTSYFEGEYKPNVFEQKLLSEKGPNGTGGIIVCPACGGVPQRVPGGHCQLCRNSCRLLVYPASNQQIS